MTTWRGYQRRRSIDRYGLVRALPWAVINFVILLVITAFIYGVGSFLFAAIGVQP